MKELKSVALLLGTMLTKDELDEFMAEADSVSIIEVKKNKFISFGAATGFTMNSLLTLKKRQNHHCQFCS